MTELKPCNPINTKHGAYKRTPTLYEVWKTMKHRCEDEKRTKEICGGHCQDLDDEQEDFEDE